MLYFRIKTLIGNMLTVVFPVVNERDETKANGFSDLQVEAVVQE